MLCSGMETVSAGTALKRLWCEVELAYKNGTSSPRAYRVRIQYHHPHVDPPRNSGCYSNVAVIDSGLAPIFGQGQPYVFVPLGDLIFRVCQWLIGCRVIISFWMSLREIRCLIWEKLSQRQKKRESLSMALILARAMLRLRLIVLSMVLVGKEEHT